MFKTKFDCVTIHYTISTRLLNECHTIWFGFIKKKIIFLKRTEFVALYKKRKCRTQGLHVEPNNESINDANKTIHCGITKSVMVKSSIAKANQMI